MDLTGPLKKIAADVTLGEGVRIYDFVNLYGCTIGDHSQVGTFVEIQRGAVIGARVKIQSHTFICEGVTIEDEVFVGHGVMFINDAYPFAQLRPGDPPVVYQKILVRRMAAIGSNATILGNVTIGEHAIVGAGAVVTRDVPPRAIVAGNPARVRRLRDRVRE
jgi:acetyltransferase-like isoleucine patch superfamily enzyme